MVSRPFLTALLRKISAKPGTRATPSPRHGAITALKPYLHDRPDGVLAARAAAEVVARDQDRGALETRGVQLEVGSSDPSGR